MDIIHITHSTNTRPKRSSNATLLRRLVNGTNDYISPAAGNLLPIFLPASIISTGEEQQGVLTQSHSHPVAVHTYLVIYLVTCIYPPFTLFLGKMSTLPEDSGQAILQQVTVSMAQRTRSLGSFLDLANYRLLDLPLTYH